MWKLWEFFLGYYLYLALRLRIEPYILDFSLFSRTHILHSIA